NGNSCSGSSTIPLANATPVVRATAQNVATAALNTKLGCVRRALGRGRGFGLASAACSFRTSRITRACTRSGSSTSFISERYSSQFDCFTFRLLFQIEFEPFARAMQARAYGGWLAVQHAGDIFEGVSL